MYQVYKTQYIMRHIVAKYLAKFAMKEAPKPLGRWSTERCAIKLDKKIDMSNEDHCGPCGEYAKKKMDLNMCKAIMKLK
jgi:hypothetical protein